MYITEWVFAIITSLGLTNTFPVFNLCDVWCWTTEMGTWVCLFCFFFFRLHRLDKLELQKKKVWLIISGELSSWFHDCRMEFHRGRYLQDELSNWLKAAMIFICKWRELWQHKIIEKYNFSFSMTRLRWNLKFSVIAYLRWKLSWR